MPAEATHVFVGARDADGVIVLGACGRRDEVLRRTESTTEAHEDNGVFWYFTFEDDEHPVSFGFSRVPAISLNSADVLGSGDFQHEADEDGHYRLSWHLDGGSGWRAGHRTEDLEGWTKLLYWR